MVYEFDSAAVDIVDEFYFLMFKTAEEKIKLERIGKSMDPSYLKFSISVSKLYLRYQEMTELIVPYLFSFESKLIPVFNYTYVNKIFYTVEKNFKRLIKSHLNRNENFIYEDIFQYKYLKESQAKELNRLVDALTNKLKNLERRWQKKRNRNKKTKIKESVKLFLKDYYLIEESKIVQYGIDVELLKEKQEKELKNKEEEIKKIIEEREREKKRKIEEEIKRKKILWIKQIF